MADIILAEISGQGWLVNGEEHIDDLLANTLSKEISIEVVICESKSEVDALWVRYCGIQDSMATGAWLIHPAILRRVKGAAAGHSVAFAAWSVLLDEEGREAIRTAAAQGGPIELVGYVAEGAKRSLTDLVDFRMRLIEEELDELGVAHARLLRSPLPGMGDDSQRIDLVKSSPADSPPR